MKRKWFIIAVLFPAFSFAQENASRSSLRTTVSSGLVAGESAAKPLFQLTSGMAYKKWFAGVGAGLDFYNLKSIPLFVDYKIGFGKNESWFAYGDFGYNFPFDNKVESSPVSVMRIDRFYGGLYLDAGIGYRIQLGSYHRLLFSAGYSRKDVGHDVRLTNIAVDPSPTWHDNYHYSFGRIAVKLGWEFGR